MAYAPHAQARADVVSGGRKLEAVSVTGTTSTLADLRDLNIAEGRFLRPDEDLVRAQVAVIGADVVDALFSHGSPVGQSIRVAGRRFEVIGVQERVGSSGAGSLDKNVWMPLLAHERAFGRRAACRFSRRPEGYTPQAGEDPPRTSLRARRALGPGVPDNFDVLTPDAARSFVATLSARIGAAAGPISLMALLAAIVVVTNTVLVSVTQRTREIGVRRALGAARTRGSCGRCWPSRPSCPSRGARPGPWRRWGWCRCWRASSRSAHRVARHGGVERGRVGGQRPGGGMVSRAAGDAD